MQSICPPNLACAQKGRARPALLRAGDGRFAPGPAGGPVPPAAKPCWFASARRAGHEVRPVCTRALVYSF